MAVATVLTGLVPLATLAATEATAWRAWLLSVVRVLRPGQGVVVEVIEADRRTRVTTDSEPLATLLDRVATASTVSTAADTILRYVREDAERQMHEEMRTREEQYRREERDQQERLAREERDAARAEAKRN